MEGGRVNEATKCRMFPTTLKGHAMISFKRLALESIGSFVELRKTTTKAQAIVDFISEFTLSTFVLYVDGASNQQAYEASLVLISFSGAKLSSNDDYVPLASGLIRYEMGKEETRGRRSKEVDLVLMGGNLKMQSHHFVAVRLNDQTGTILGFVVYLALMTTIGFLEVSCGC
ncbi:unnamed protein product [Prunus armeniaca]|uniref:Uncharacterized protein n=1 Tax=Prunus armeniaca TaxID=36596 RepID=A0A6J5V6L6_PRUAR|nr:unnamed protein product [Prunus armeniaca]